MKFIIGEKIDMTQIWKGDKMIAVTRVKAGPCVVLQVKDKARDGYQAIQFGYGERKEKNIKKPQKNHFKNLGFFKTLKEVRTEADDLKVGDVVDVTAFSQGDIIKVTSTSKGKGYQGVVKRHGFRGHKATHGTKDQVRMPGSSGATAPQHVFKGVRKPGHMGNDKSTISNLQIIDIDEKNNIFLIKGGIPGARHTTVFIKADGVMKAREAKPVVSENIENKEESTPAPVSQEEVVVTEVEEKESK